MKKRDNNLVYSTDQGRLCPDCEKPTDQCRCKASKTAPSGDGVIRVRKEVAGRKGKTVTVVTGAPVEGLELLGLAKDLKKKI